MLGRTVGLNGVAYTIVGVAQPRFRGLTGEAEIWVPITTLSAGELGEAWNHSYQVVARRKADTSVEAAQAEVTVLGRRIYEQIPDPFPGDGGPGKGVWGATAVPLDDQRIDPLIRRSILLLGAAVASVLLIVCVNLANLMLVRGLAREREVAIRLALGASRLRIVRQLMTESLVLAIAGTLIGLAVAYAAISAGASLAPDLRMVLPRGRAGGRSDARRPRPRRIRPHGAALHGRHRDRDGAALRTRSRVARLAPRSHGDHEDRIVRRGVFR